MATLIERNDRLSADINSALFNQTDTLDFITSYYIAIDLHQDAGVAPPKTRQVIHDTSCQAFAKGRKYFSIVLQ